MAGKGLFIVLEGIDGSGKDTHLKFLARKLRELGYAVVETAEPSRYGVGAFLKRYAKRKERRLPAESEALLYASDRFDHVKNVIKPALRRDQIVISARYYYSSMAYQGAVGVDLDWIREMNRFALKPDLAILLDILPEYSLHRLKRRRSIYEDSDYLRKVRDIYIKLVNQGELVKVDADRPKRVVQGELLSMVLNSLHKRAPENEQEKSETQ
ncbi:MAG: dTMP kinase [Candidatus Bathyarchaeota archaeon]|nr:dTMP kinase [Candidatus Bathyarchaeota archaeon]